MNILKKNKGIIYFYLVLIIGTIFLIYENDQYQMNESSEDFKLIAQK